MRHHNHNRKLKRKSGQRKALLKTLATSLVRYEKISTTEAKAKELRPFVEKLVTYAKKGTISGRRQVEKQLSKSASFKLVNKLAPKYKERNGGYTRILSLGHDVKTGGKKSRIEFV